MNNQLPPPLGPNEPVTPQYINFLLNPATLFAIPPAQFHLYVTPGFLASLTPAQRGAFNNTLSQVMAQQGPPGPFQPRGPPPHQQGPPPQQQGPPPQQQGPPQQQRWVPRVLSPDELEQHAARLREQIRRQEQCHGNDGPHPPPPAGQQRQPGAAPVPAPVAPKLIELLDPALRAWSVQVGGNYTLEFLWEAYTSCRDDATRNLMGEFLRESANQRPAAAPADAPPAVAAPVANAAPIRRPPPPPPTPETRSIALVHQSHHKLIPRPASLAAAISKAADLFQLAPERITLRFLAGTIWCDVLEESWNLSALTKDDPTTLQVVVGYNVTIVPLGGLNAPIKMLWYSSTPAQEIFASVARRIGRTDTSFELVYQGQHVHRWRTGRTETFGELLSEWQWEAGEGGDVKLEVERIAMEVERIPKAEDE